MKKKKIIEAFDQMLPAKERYDKNLEQIIRRLEAQEPNAETINAEENDIKRYVAYLEMNNRKRRWERISAAIIVFMASISIMFATNSETLAGVLNWFRHEKEDDPNSYVYEFKGDYSNKKLLQITIGWLPDDFEGVKPRIGDLDDDHTFDRLYTTNNGRTVAFSIEYMDRGERVYIMPEFGEVLQSEEFTINAKRAAYYEDSQSNCLFVFDDEMGLMIQIDANIEKEEMIKIAENIQYEFK